MPSNTKQTSRPSRARRGEDSRRLTTATKALEGRRGFRLAQTRYPAATEE